MKKNYIFPVVEITLCNTQQLMTAGDRSYTPDDPGAPAIRRTYDTTHRTPVF